MIKLELIAVNEPKLFVTAYKNCQSYFLPRLVTVYFLQIL